MERFSLAKRNFWNRPGKDGKFWIALPAICILLFLLLYLVAAWRYPGGSFAHPEHTGFDIRNNYLCDLLDTFAINGNLNEGRFYARSALFFLCGGLLYLWFYLPELFAEVRLLHIVMWLSGMLALGIIFFMAAHNHDLIVRLAGVFGVIGLVSCSYALLQEGYIKAGILGVICTLVFLINYYIYETSVYIETLPSIQKVTFILCLSWFLDLNYHLYQRIAPKKNNNAGHKI